MLYEFYDKNSLAENILSSKEKLRETFLNNRGISDVKKYLDFSDTSRDLDWGVLKYDFIFASELLNETLNNGGKISIVVDSDCDGFCSAAIIYNYIKRIKPDADVKYIIHPTLKCHGLSDIVRNNLIPTETKLLVVPDAGTNDVEECKYIKDNLTAQILILDHHEIETTETTKYATVINSQYQHCPNHDICGAGVTYKFISVYDEMYGFNYSKDYLDLVALANIADVMDIRADETRYLIEQGLHRVENPFLKAVLNAQSYSIDDITSPTIKDLGWKVSPLINSIVRCGSAEEQEIMFRAFVGDYDEFTQKKRDGSVIIEDIYERATRLAKNAHSRQSNAVKKAVAELKSRYPVDKSEEDNVVVVDVGEYCAPGFVGLLANKAKDIYKKPVILVHKDEDKYRGSARNIENATFDFREITTNAPDVIFASGHADAFGVEIECDKLDEFKEYFNTEFNKDYFKSVDLVDFETSPEDIDDEMIIDCNSLKQYEGTNIPPLKVLINNVCVKDNIEVLSGNTVKFMYCGNTYIVFGLDDNDELLTACKNFNGYSSVIIDVIGTPSVNMYNGLMNLQIVIDNFEVIAKNKRENFKDSAFDIDDEW